MAQLTDRPTTEVRDVVLLSMDRMFAQLVEKWSAYRAAVISRAWWGELGESWDQWSSHSVADMAMHASDELVHHGAEIALLRDLYRVSQT